MTKPSLLLRVWSRAMLLLVFAVSTTLQAQLVWEPENGGWRIEGEPTREDGALRHSPRALMMLTLAREAQERGEQGAALRQYKQVINEFGTTIFAPEARFQSAKIRIERKQWPKAFDHLQAIVDNHPEYPGFGEVIRLQFEIADGLRQGERLRLFYTIPGFRSPERAVEYFEKVVENAPYSEHAPIALLHAANIEASRGRPDPAIELYDRFISDYPNHEKISDAYFGLAETFSSRMRGPAYDQGSNREAISYYEDFALLYPRHTRAPEAEDRALEMSEVLAESRIILGDFYFRYRNNLTAARVFYNEAITLAPLSEAAGEAREKLVQVEQREERK